ncbi:MAG: hypothetical protein ACOCQ6_01835 [Bacteroidota bacterium]
MLKVFWLFVVILIAFLQGFGQGEAGGKQERLLLELDYTGFFKNNEFFADQAEGYTLTGNHITSFLNYRLGDRASLNTGVHFRYYHGMDSLAEVAPFISLHLKPGQFTDITLGSYRLNEQYGVSTVLLFDEHRLTDYTGEGVRASIHKIHLWMDAWIDWEKFILHGDPFREEFQAGLSGDWTFLDLSSSSLSLISQWLVEHKGGQIDNSVLPVSTVLNTHHGLVFRHDFPPGFLTYGKVSLGYFTYRDINGNAPWTHEEGNAMQAKLKLNLKQHSLSGGYFEAEEFMAPYGHPLFQTSDLNNPEKHFQHLEMLHAGYHFQQQFYEGLSVAFIAQGFYLMRQERLHHSMEFRAILNRSFFLKAFAK